MNVTKIYEFTLKLHRQVPMAYLLHPLLEYVHRDH